MAGVKAGCAHLCRVAGNTVWSHMASDTPLLWGGIPLTAIHFLYLYLYVCHVVRLINAHYYYTSIVFMLTGYSGLGAVLKIYFVRAGLLTSCWCPLANQYQGTEWRAWSKNSRDRAFKIVQKSLWRRNDTLRHFYSMQRIWIWRTCRKVILML